MYWLPVLFYSTLLKTNKLVSFSLLLWEDFGSLRIPERVRRPAAATEALGLGPRMEANWADASRVECVPFVAARAAPEVFFARRPAAERTANAWRFRLAGPIFFFKLAVWNYVRVV
jgi:hypothetical protein